MAERPDQIERHIASTRSELGSNLQELEEKVKQAADWRTYYERNPMTMVALAFGGGVLLASMTGSSGEDRGDRNRSERALVTQSHRPENSFAGSHGSQVNETWQNLKAAIIGMAGMKVRAMLDEALPGFSQHYDKVAHEHTGYSRSPNVQNEYESSSHRM